MVSVTLYLFILLVLYCFWPCLAAFDGSSAISDPLTEVARGNSYVSGVYLNRIHLNHVQIYLHLVPRTAFEERSFDVSIWYKKQSNINMVEKEMSVGLGESVESDEQWQHLATMNNFYLDESSTPNFCSCYTYFTFDQGLFDFRAVLRFGNDEAELKNTPPSVKSILPSFSDEIQVFPTESDDYYTISKWTNPDVSDGRAKDLSNLLFDFLDKAEASTTSSGKVVGDTTPSLETVVRKGWSGQKFQMFMNSIGSISGTTYLEVGIYNGSSLISILDGNNIKAVAIDIWDVNDPIASAMKEDVTSFVHTMYNHSAGSDVHILHTDCWTVTPRKVKQLLGGASVNVYFYDAGHTVSDHFLSFAHFYSAMDDTFIFIVDDWNWPVVRKGTYEAMAMYPIEIVSQIEITTLQSPSTLNKGMSNSWHNGMMAFVLVKKIM